MKKSLIRVIDWFHALLTRQHGLFLVVGKRNYYVLYPDGNISYPMAFGNAYDYAKIFHGEVKRIKR